MQTSSSLAKLVSRVSFRGLLFSEFYGMHVNNIVRTLEASSSQIKEEKRRVPVQTLNPVLAIVIGTLALHTLFSKSFKFWINGRFRETVLVTLPNLTFCPKKEVSVNARLGEG